MEVEETTESSSKNAEKILLTRFVDLELREQEFIEGMQEKLGLSNNDDREEMVALFDAIIAALSYQRAKYINDEDECE